MAETTKRYRQGIGRRKTAVAIVRLYPGKGDIQVNEKPMAEYFTVERWQTTVASPLKLLGRDNKYDITIKLKGGGVSAQADAVALGISRALIIENEEWKQTLKKAGLMTRDPRMKERRKYGLKKARKAPQFSKR